MLPVPWARHSFSRLMASMLRRVPQVSEVSSPSDYDGAAYPGIVGLTNTNQTVAEASATVTYDVAVPVEVVDR